MAQATNITMKDCGWCDAGRVLDEGKRISCSRCNGTGKQATATLPTGEQWEQADFYMCSGACDGKDKPLDAGGLCVECAALASSAESESSDYGVAVAHAEGRS